MIPDAAPGVDREVARILQELLDKLNAKDPRMLDVPWMIANPRHPCPKARQSHNLGGREVSAAIDCKERYLVLAEFPEVALIWREGVCKRCGMGARSSRGRVVLVADRPPVSGRVARE